MLNEMFVLERGLAASGFVIGERHPDVQSPGRATALRLRLDPFGRPVELDLMGSDRVASLWTLRNGKHNSFPYVKLRRPVLSVPDDDAWHDAFRAGWSDSDRRQTLKRLAGDHPPDAAVGDSIMTGGPSGEASRPGSPPSMRCPMHPLACRRCFRALSGSTGLSRRPSSRRC